MLNTCQAGGIDFVGINFVETSKRRVQLPLKKQENEVFERVGVFVNPTMIALGQAIENYQLQVIQLHGNESLEFIDNCLQEFPNIKLWKALSVDENLNHEKLQQYCKKCDLILFDGKKPGSGNTILDQEKLSEAIFRTQSFGTKVGLAGGINDQNITTFKQKFPNIDLLDTASGIEIDGQFSVPQTQLLINNFNA